MKTAVELLTEWANFTATRESERIRLTNPEGSAELKAELQEAKLALQEAKAKVQLLSAKLAVAMGGNQYNKALFDAQWAAKKLELKEQVEEAIMKDLESGKSIPTLLAEYPMSNTVWLYRIRERMSIKRESESVKLEGIDWHWSDFTGTQRYALGGLPDGSLTWDYVKIMGTVDTDLEGQYAVCGYQNGEFIAGSREVYETGQPHQHRQRAALLASVLDGTYSGAWKSSENPYFAKEAA